MTAGPPDPVLLVVDDDRVSVMAVRRAVRQSGLPNPVEIARDGEEALAALRARPPDAAPCIVLLDLNMPRMGGLEFLARLRADPGIRGSVVFVLTTSDAPEDISRAYAHAVAGYLVKDDPRSSLRDAIDLIGRYASVVRLP